MTEGNRVVRLGGLVVAVLLAGAVMVAATGCTRGTPNSMTIERTTPANSMGTAGVTDIDLQTCSDCAGKGTAPMVQGRVRVEGEAQVIDVGVQGGYYAPNYFKIVAGTPVKVVFTGKAKGCLARPQFKALGKQADFTGGTETVELGALAPGTYEFVCGMSMTGGKIVAE
jgi:plastocyanin